MLHYICVLTCCKSESHTSKRSSVSDAMPILSKCSPVIPPLTEELNPFISIVVVIILIVSQVLLFFLKFLLWLQTYSNKSWGTSKIDQNKKSCQITHVNGSLCLAWPCSIDNFFYAEAVVMIQLAFSLQLTSTHSDSVLVWTTTLTRAVALLRME